MVVCQLACGYQILTCASAQKSMQSPIFVCKTLFWERVCELFVVEEPELHCRGLVWEVLGLSGEGFLVEVAVIGKIPNIKRAGSSFNELIRRVWSRKIVIYTPHRYIFWWQRQGYEKISDLE